MTTAEPAAARPAATVVLARDRLDSGKGIEVFLVQRHGNLGFMGGMHVFPGGTLSSDDLCERMQSRIHDIAEERVLQPWGTDVERPRAIGLAVAAIRETFEEAGVLLCDAPDTARLTALRARLLAGEAFAGLLEEAGLHLNLDVLTPLSRWITPKLEPKRYDTLFFLAHAPAKQRAEHDRQETIAGAWLSPEAALAKGETGEIRLAPPTARTLAGLREASSVAEARARARARVPPKVEPIIRVAADEVWIYFPGDPEHPEREAALEGPTRQVLRRLDRAKSG